MDNIVELLTYLAITSVAAERITDIVKRLVLEKFVTNGGVYQVVSGLFGGWLAYYTPPDMIASRFNEWITVILVGLCVSGGSSVWYNLIKVLSEYRKSIANIKVTIA